MNCLFSLHYVTTLLRVSGPFVAHHQEVKRIMWQRQLFAFKATIGGPGSGTSSCLSTSLKPLTHYTLGLLMMGYKWTRNM
jgi:hypothetical protein